MEKVSLIIKDLKKFYGKTLALKGISFEVLRGELFSLLGPNGAGKTTTLKILAGLTNATSGEIYLFGKSLFEEELWAKRKIGYVPQHINLDLELTVKENLFIHGLLYQMSLKEIKKRTDEVLELAELKERKDSKVKELSGGLRRRLLIARALMHAPELLLLDEPTVGLDPHIRRKIWSFIKAIQEKGTTILLTTHYMEEAEALSNRVAFINHGEIIKIGTPSSLVKTLGQFALDIYLDSEIKTYYFKTKEEAEKALFEYSKKYSHVTLRKITLEDVFLKLTSEKT